jgi:hypothetical protein
VKRNIVILALVASLWLHHVTEAPVGPATVWGATLMAFGAVAAAALEMANES